MKFVVWGIVGVLDLLAGHPILAVVGLVLLAGCATPAAPTSEHPRRHTEVRAR